MKSFKADFHIHTCLSPCADLDMTPRAIVEKSVETGLDAIAICDHNSAENVRATIRAAMRYKLRVLPGLEISSREEVHTLAIFENTEKALLMQEIVYQHIKGINRPALFGEQVVANEFDEVEGFNDQLLIGATQLGLQQIINHVHGLGGLCIASHVDRPSFSVLSQLGFIPPHMELDALEISRRTNLESILSQMPETKGFPLVAFSDAHQPDQIGRHFTRFMVEAPNVDEIRMALKEKSGRRVEV